MTLFPKWCHTTGPYILEYKCCCIICVCYVTGAAFLQASGQSPKDKRGVNYRQSVCVSDVAPLVSVGSSTRQTALSLAAYTVSMLLCPRLYPLVSLSTLFIGLVF